MKKVSKILLVALSMVLLVTVSVVGTLAYLTSRDSVTNTFTVGNVSIIVDEARVNEDGQPFNGEDVVNREDAPRVKVNDYHLLPGQTYTKDPTMSIKEASEESYVRMVVTINKSQATLDQAFGEAFLPQNYVTGWDSSLWPCVGITERMVNGFSVVTYEFRYYTTVEGAPSNGNGVPDYTALEPLFTSLTIPGRLTGDQLALLTDLRIDVQGHAIQATGFDNADAAWAAFDTQMNTTNP